MLLFYYKYQNIPLITKYTFVANLKIPKYMICCCRYMKTSLFWCSQFVESSLIIIVREIERPRHYDYCCFAINIKMKYCYQILQIAKYMFDVYLRPKYTICPAKYTTDICCRYGNLIVLVFIVSQVIINNYYSKKDQDIMTASLHQILHYYLLTSIMPTA